MTQTRKIRLGAFLPGGGQHIAAWRHPDSPVDGATSFDFHVRLAQEAERGLFDAYFLADGLAAETEEDAIKIWKEAEALLMRDLPVLPLWYQNTIGGYSTLVSDVEYGWDTVPLYHNITK